MLARKILLPLLMLIFSAITFAQTSDFSQDHGITEVEVQGIGSTMKQAIISAQRNAIDTAIGTIITSETEVNNYVTVKDKILAKSEGFVKSYEVIDKAREEDGSWTVTIKAYVSKEMVLSDLEAMGILMSQLDNPSIVVFYAPRGTKYDQRYTEQGINQINQYFTTFRYDVYDLDQLNAMLEDDMSMKDAVGGDVDLASILAKKLKSDIYVTVALMLEDLGNGKKKAKATAKIFNASTAKLLGVQNGYSDEIYGNNSAYDANIDQAVKKLMPLIMKQVKGFWKEQIDKGRQFSLHFSNLPKGFKTKKALKQAIAGTVKEYKKISNGEYKVWFQGTMDELQEAIYEPVMKIYGKEIDMNNRGDRIDVFPAE